MNDAKVLGQIKVGGQNPADTIDQKKKATNGFIITGKVKSEKKITLSDLTQYVSKKIGDITITNHLGAIKGTAKDLKGVLLKDILGKIEFQADNPKVLSEFFITCVASDGYKIVFSWNELFNTETGNNAYIITEKEEIKAVDMEDRVLLISATDFKTGRRYLKGLEKIIVERVQ